MSLSSKYKKRGNFVFCNKMYKRGIIGFYKMRGLSENDLLRKRRKIKLDTQHECLTGETEHCTFIYSLIFSFIGLFPKLQHCCSYWHVILNKDLMPDCLSLSVQGRKSDSTGKQMQKDIIERSVCCYYRMVRERKGDGRELPPYTVSTA